MSRRDLKRKKPVVGLAGGIGAGKSSVARVLESLGAAVIDSDRQCHVEFDDPEVVATLRRWWGDAVCGPGGEVDRQALAGIVFDNPAELARLEGLLYPRLARRREELLGTYEADPQVRAIVLDSPKLFEAGLNELCDAVIFVDASRSVRARRLAETRGWTEKTLQKRETLLKPLDMKRALADHVVVNHSSIAALRSQVERVFSSVLAALSD